MNKRKKNKEGAIVSDRKQYQSRSPKMMVRDISLSTDTVRSNIEAFLRQIKEIPDNYRVTKLKFNPESLNNETVLSIHWEGEREKEAIITKSNG